MRRYFLSANCWHLHLDLGVSEGPGCTVGKNAKKVKNFEKLSKNQTKYTKASKASRFQSDDLFLFSKVPKMKLRDCLCQKVPKNYFITYKLYLAKFLQFDLILLLKRYKYLGFARLGFESTLKWGLCQRASKASKFQSVEPPRRPPNFRRFGGLGVLCTENTYSLYFEKLYQIATLKLE